MAKQGEKAKQQKRAASAKRVPTPKRTASAKRVKKAGAKAGAPPEKDLPQIDVPTASADGGASALARVEQLEADRTNLLAQVAWARAVAQEQQKSLEAERERTEKLSADLEAQRTRIEQLKALTVMDRLLGRHKGI